MKAPLNKARVLTGRQCPYCGGDSELIDSDAVYSKSYGMIYICRPCEAWVGVHRGSGVALGRLADAELRELKQESHKYFDQLWRRKMKVQGVSKHEARSSAYKWLSEQIGVPADECHIGMFDLVQCYAAITVCKPHYRNDY